MKVIDPYRARINAQVFNELVELAREQIAAGDFEEGRRFDSEALARLRAFSSDFTALPQIAAGQRATAEDLLYLVRMLGARFNGIAKEARRFHQELASLIESFEDQLELCESLYRLAELEAWAEKNHRYRSGKRFAVSLASGLTPVAASVAAIDPQTGVEYPSKPDYVKWDYRLDPSRSHLALRGGMAASHEVTEIRPAGLRWHFESIPGVEVEELARDDWAKLAVLSPARLHSGSSTDVYTIQPAGGNAREYFDIEGQPIAEAVSVFVDVAFRPRLQKKTVILDGPVSLSPYQIDLSDVQVFSEDGTTFYEEGIDYTLSGPSTIQPGDSLAGKTVVVSFTEYFPSYRCSMNEIHWSPPVFFDPERPLVDLSSPIPKGLERDRFPVLDETGMPVGLFLRPRKLIDQEFRFRIDAMPSGVSEGLVATLEVEFEFLRILNGLRLRPAGTTQLRIRRIYEAPSFGATPTRLLFASRGLEEDLVIEEETVLRFPAQPLGRLFIEFVQPNYRIKQHLVKSSGYWWKALAARALPGRFQPPEVRAVAGYQYDILVDRIEGQYIRFQSPSVAVFGPFLFPGVPAVFRLTAESTGSVEFYLIDRPLDDAGQPIESAYVTIDPSNQLGIPVALGLDQPYFRPVQLPEQVEFYVKIVFRQAESVVEKFLLEMA